MPDGDQDVPPTVGGNTPEDSNNITSPGAPAAGESHQSQAIPPPNPDSVTSGSSASSPTPVAPKSDKKKKLSLLAILIIAAVVLLGGGAGAYFGVIVPNKPENVLKTALSNYIDQPRYKFDGKATVDVNAPNAGDSLNTFDVTFNGQVDLEANSFQFKTGLNILGVKPEVEVSKVGRTIYFNVGDLNQYQSLSQLGGPDVAAMVEEVNKSVGSQWIEIDESLFKQAKPGAECLLDFPKPYSKDDVEAMTDLYTNREFVTIKSTTTETLDGRDALKYDLDFNQDKLKDYTSNAFQNLSTYREFSECVEKIAGKKVDKLLEEQNQAQPVQQSMSTSMWVDKGSKTIKKISMVINTTQNDVETKTNFEGTFDYGNVSIVKPEKSKPIMQVIGELTPLFQGLEGEASPAFDTLGQFDFN